MARRPDAPSRMEILLLSTLARRPMHGYEVEVELRYKHVRWWAKCERGHLYAALGRLEKRGEIRHLRSGKPTRSKRVLEITELGRERLRASLESLGGAEDATFFDVDLFLSSAFFLEKKRVIELLGLRAEQLDLQLAEAKRLRLGMADHVPAAARLIIEHRVEHLRREAAFCRRAMDAFRAAKSWGPFLGDEPIRDFVRRTGVELESPRRSSAG